MTKQIFAGFIGTLFAGAIFIAVIKLAGPFPLSVSQTTTNKQATFDVTGEGQAVSAPDRATLNLGISENGTSVKDVQDKGNQVINTITKDLTGMGIDSADIKTTNYNLYPQYSYQNGSQQINGYSLNISLEINIKDFTKIGQAIDTATKDGSNQVGGISFSLSDAKKHDLEDQARALAIQQAKQKAQSLSSLASVRLGKIVNITESENTQFPRPILPMAAGVVPQTQTVPTEVQPGTTTVHLSVTLSFELL